MSKIETGNLSNKGLDQLALINSQKILERERKILNKDQDLTGIKELTGKNDVALNKSNSASLVVVDEVPIVSGHIISADNSNIYIPKLAESHPPLTKEEGDSIKGSLSGGGFSANAGAIEYMLQLILSKINNVVNELRQSMNEYYAQIKKQQIDNSSLSLNAAERSFEESMSAAWVQGATGIASGVVAIGTASMGIVGIQSSINKSKALEGFAALEANSKEVKDEIETLNTLLKKFDNVPDLKYSDTQKNGLFSKINLANSSHQEYINQTGKTISNIDDYKKAVNVFSTIKENYSTDSTAYSNKANSSINSELLKKLHNRIDLTEKEASELASLKTRQEANGVLTQEESKQLKELIQSRASLTDTENSQLSALKAKDSATLTLEERNSLTELTAKEEQINNQSMQIQQLSKKLSEEEVARLNVLSQRNAGGLTPSEVKQQEELRKKDKLTPEEQAKLSELNRKQFGLTGTEESQLKNLYELKLEGEKLLKNYNQSLNYIEYLKGVKDNFQNQIHNEQTVTQHMTGLMTQVSNVINSLGHSIAEGKQATANLLRNLTDYISQLVNVFGQMASDLAESFRRSVAEMFEKCSQMVESFTHILTELYHIRG